MTLPSPLTSSEGHLATLLPGNLVGHLPICSRGSLHTLVSLCKQDVWRCCLSDQHGVVVAVLTLLQDLHCTWTRRPRQDRSQAGAHLRAQSRHAGRWQRTSSALILCLRDSTNNRALPSVKQGSQQVRSRAMPNHST